jgi:hypothetical protein
VSSLNNRVIKFRGKRIDNGELVYGYYAVLPKFTFPVALMGEETYCEDGADYIIEFKTMQHPNFSSAYPLQVCDKEVYEVDPATVGQFTGLRDCKRTEEYPEGQEIYEGDILRVPAKDEYEKTTYNSFEVFWHDNDYTPTDCGLVLGRLTTHGNSAGGYSGYKLIPKHVGKMEVIGNIHEGEGVSQ